jgi:hypothetical protein
MGTHRLHHAAHLAPILLGLAIAIVLLLIGARHAHGATLVVPDEYATIQSAIDAAR